jgi:Rod binding domain-containing protein
VSTSLPPIDNSMLPADVRAGSTADQDRYKSALSFENEFVQQLTQQLADTTKSTGGDDSDSDDGTGSSDGSSAATDSYQQMLPGVLADSIMSAGGLGLARTIAQSMKDSGQ